MTTPVLISRTPAYRVNAVGMISLTIIVLWALVAIFAPYLTPYGIGDIVDTDYFGPTSAKFLLGTDYLRRDMVSRIIMGARYTVGIALAAVAISCITGVTLGMTAAVVGGWFDLVLSRFLDALNSIPSKLFGLVVVAGVGSSIPVLSSANPVHCRLRYGEPRYGYGYSGPRRIDTATEGSGDGSARGNGVVGLPRYPTIATITDFPDKESSTPQSWSIGPKTVKHHIRSSQLFLRRTLRFLPIGAKRVYARSAPSRYSGDKEGWQLRLRMINRSQI